MTLYMFDKDDPSCSNEITTLDLIETPKIHEIVKVVRISNE